MKNKLTSKDIEAIKQAAMAYYKDKPSRIEVSKIEFNPVHLGLIEGTIAVLNRNGFLKEVPDLDYTERLIESLDDTNS
jgi:hypothetical protein